MPNNVHDALFKATFSQIEHAEGELKLLLPPKLVARIDFKSLTLCPGSFVDQELAERHTDLLFSANIAGRAAFVYVLFEHQSTVDPLMPFRLLRYMVRIWDGYVADHPSARLLPAILPVVLHHSETGWRAGVRFEDLLDVDGEMRAAIAEHVPRFRFLLDDLNRESDEALHTRAMSAFGRLVLWCLKHARASDELVKGLRGWADLLREVRTAPNGAAALATIWRYIFAVNERRLEELLPLLVAAVGEDGREELMTTAEYLIEQGREEGLRKGLQEGRRALLLKQLSARFGALPEDAVARVNAADAAKLDLWAERVLTAPTLADVLENA
jgi:hypothetical protein